MDYIDKEVFFKKYCRTCVSESVPEDELPCHDCLNEPINTNSHKPVNYKNSDKKESKYDYISKKKIKDFVYELSYEDIDYENAYQYFMKHADYERVGCSSIVSGNWYGRNFDWIYNNQAEFIIHIPRINNRYSSIGIAGGFSELTEEFVNSGEQSELYKLIPFRTYDGINEYGVFANVNVVPTDKGATTKSIPLKGTAITISANILIRYILDHFKTATEAVEYIRDKVSIYFMIDTHEMCYEYHYMIGDSNHTYILEIVDNKVIILEHNMMTNFYISGVRFDPSSGKVYTPATQRGQWNAVDYNYITEHGSGLERYNIMRDFNISNKNDMRDLMSILKYTNAYSEHTYPVWNTEFVGNSLTVKSSPAQFSNEIYIAQYFYRNRSRETGYTWHTVHSSVYDIENRKLYVIFQEDGEELCYGI